MKNRGKLWNHGKLVAPLAVKGGNIRGENFVLAKSSKKQEKNGVFLTQSSHHHRLLQSWNECNPFAVLAAHTFSIAIFGLFFVEWVENYRFLCNVRVLQFTMLCIKCKWRFFSRFFDGVAFFGKTLQFENKIKISTHLWLVSGAVRSFFFLLHRMTLISILQAIYIHLRLQIFSFI